MNFHGFPRPLMAGPKYKRVLLKLSGEAFCSEGGRGLEIDPIDSIASQIRDAHRIGSEVAIVVGGGNIVRGGELATRGVSQDTGDSARNVNCFR